MIIRVLALKNVNVISKDFLTFYGSKTFASENCKLCYSTILNVQTNFVDKDRFGIRGPLPQRPEKLFHRLNW